MLTEGSQYEGWEYCPLGAVAEHAFVIKETATNVERTVEHYWQIGKISAIPRGVNGSVSWRRMACLKLVSKEISTQRETMTNQWTPLKIMNCKIFIENYIIHQWCVSSIEIVKWLLNAIRRKEIKFHPLSRNLQLNLFHFSFSYTYVSGISFSIYSCNSMFQQLRLHFSFRFHLKYSSFLLWYPPQIIFKNRRTSFLSIRIR